MLSIKIYINSNCLFLMIWRLCFQNCECFSWCMRTLRVQEPWGPEGSSWTGELGENLGPRRRTGSPRSLGGQWQREGKTHVQVQDVRIGAVLEEGVPVFQGQMAMWGHGGKVLPGLSVGRWRKAWETGRWMPLGPFNITPQPRPTGQPGSYLYLIL